MAVLGPSLFHDTVLVQSCFQGTRLSYIFVVVVCFTDWEYHEGWFSWQVQGLLEGSDKLSLAGRETLSTDVQPKTSDRFPWDSLKKFTVNRWVLSTSVDVNVQCRDPLLLINRLIQRLLPYVVTLPPPDAQLLPAANVVILILCTCMW